MSKPEPMVRVVGARCEGCGRHSEKARAPVYGKMPFVAPVEWVRKAAGRYRHVLTPDGSPGCGGRVLLATEPAP